MILTQNFKLIGLLIRDLWGAEARGRFWGYSDLAGDLLKMRLGFNSNLIDIVLQNIFHSINLFEILQEYALGI